MTVTIMSKGARSSFGTSPPRRAFTVKRDGWLTHQIWGMGHRRSRSGSRRFWPKSFCPRWGTNVLQEWDRRRRLNSKTFTLHAVPPRIAPYTGGDGTPVYRVAHSVLATCRTTELMTCSSPKANVQQMPREWRWKIPTTYSFRMRTSMFVETGLEAGLASLHRARGCRNG